MIRVVGGGIAGLAAAYRLQSQGHDVTVHEAGSKLGGLAATYETPGDDVEVFYHHLSKTEETIVELAEELGVGDRLEWRIGKNAYYVDGVVHPLDTFPQIIAYPHLSLYDKFRLGMLVLGVDVRGGIPSTDTYEALESFEDVPVEEFVVEHTTQGVYDRFFEPLLDAKFGDRVDDVSAAWLLGRIRFRGERDPLRGELLGYFEGGFAPVIDALVDAVGRDNIETGHRVTDLHVTGSDGATDANGDADVDADTDPISDPESDTDSDLNSDPDSGSDSDSDATSRTEAGNATPPARTGDSNAASDGGVVAVDSSEPGSDADRVADSGAETGRRVEAITVETAGGTDRLDADAVVVAAMPNVLEDLTGYECTIHFQGAVCALVTVPEPVTDTYWLNVAHDAPFGAVIEHTNFVPPERYDGQHLVYIASYVQSPEEWLWQADDEAIERRWLDHLGEMFPDFDPASVTEFRLARNPRAAPVYERGYLEQVVPYDLSAAVGEGVYYAGMASRAQYPERSLNGGVVAGYEVADRIDGSL
jgi:protoporphyrinogen oxidase